MTKDLNVNLVVSGAPQQTTQEAWFDISSTSHGSAEEPFASTAKFEMNQTINAEFFLLGFPNLQRVKTLVFMFLLVLYLITLSGNVVIMWLVASCGSLHSPMYFFLTQLSLADILLITDIVPNALWIICNKGRTMSLTECILQFHFFCWPESLECFLLSVMAYDRYLAICRPLRYHTLMNPMLCLKLIVICWFISFFATLIDIINLSQLQFCGPSRIDHFYCDIVPLMELTCSDTSFFRIEILLLCVPVAFTPLVVITVSYVYIVHAVLKITTTSGRRKAFSTCSSHLIVVSTYYGLMIGIYMLPARGKSLNVGKVFSLFYTVVTPMVNPIIYSLRNHDIREAIEKKIYKTNISDLK
ncbi:olfactory receptor 6F1-like [Spea bombifrons]|uniref:olfactory receptor 6F1-like n=1 Tax=Spea bombifrons TaxID=233779 RepID=UPI002349F506|nr:olfactory receptor 6F1-like [Spea bombifrons]